MTPKTQVAAEAGRQDLMITRTFELPVDLLFKAFTQPDLLEQWMGTKVLKLENKKHGSYQFETSRGSQVVFQANGTIHEFIPGQKIIRTFEMENTAVGVQLEFLEFRKLAEDKSMLTMQIVYQSVAHRAEQLKMPFAFGINSAHNRLQETLDKIN